MIFRSIILAFSCTSIVWCAEPLGLCQASPEIQAEFQNAATISSSVTDPFGALERSAPFLAVRDRHPNDLFTHEKYQDAMHENGIEGHLRLLAKQYGELDAKHLGDPMYHYLSLRTLVDRSTPEAIRGLNELLGARQDFAPAHRTLAEIYGTDAFHDLEKERSDKEKFLARCPEGTFTRRPAPVPDVSPLIDQAGRLLGEHGDPDRIIDMAIQGLKEFEWRSQKYAPLTGPAASTSFRTPARFGRNTGRLGTSKCAAIGKLDGRKRLTHYWQIWSNVQRPCGPAGRCLLGSAGRPSPAIHRRKPNGTGEPEDR